MKKTLLSVLLAVLCLLAAGCVRMDADITINKDGKADYSLTFAMMSTGDADTSEYGLSGEEITTLLDKGITYSLYSEDNYSGYTLTGENLNPSDILDVYNSNQSLLTVKGNKYTLDWDVMADADASSLSSLSMISDYGGYMRITLNLPENAKLSSSNATEVSADGRTLTWDLLQLNADEHVSAQFTIGHNIRLPIMIAVIAVLVAAAVVLLIFLFRSMGIGQVVTVNIFDDISDTGAETDEDDFSDYD